MGACCPQVGPESEAPSQDGFLPGREGHHAQEATGYAVQKLPLVLRPKFEARRESMKSFPRYPKGQREMPVTSVWNKLSESLRAPMRFFRMLTDVIINCHPSVNSKGKEWSLLKREAILVRTEVGVQLLHSASKEISVAL